jgi:hypothetical protein
MIGKDILSQVFGITFKEENYTGQIAKLDAQGYFDQKKVHDLLVKLCEAVDTLEEKINATSRAK